MKTKMAMIAIALMLSPALISLRADENEWKEIREKHFLVYYEEDKSAAENTARKAEEYYVEIARELGIKRFDNFWLWDNRARIYLYDDRMEFVRDTESPEWASGKADYVNKTIYGFRGSRDFLESLLPHEIAHLIFRDFLGFDANAPLWLDEGVAMWSEPARRENVRHFMLKLRDANKTIPLDQLTSMNVASLKDGAQAMTFYAQASSIVGFMISKLGSDQFRKFCGEIRDGKSVNDALRFTYTGKMDTITELEEAWLADLNGADEKQQGKTQ